jgi:ectoine hydroxylase-related dioxygenase (phytanoyl-CoA dioxygenase family)
MAGDATFHHGRCPHMATPNLSADKRVAHVVIFMPAETLYSGAGHVVTDPLGLKAGDQLDGELFPRV